MIVANLPPVARKFRRPPTAAPSQCTLRRTALCHSPPSPPAPGEKGGGWGQGRGPKRLVPGTHPAFGGPLIRPSATFSPAGRRTLRGCLAHPQTSERRSPGNAPTSPFSPRGEGARRADEGCPPDEEAGAALPARAPTVVRRDKPSAFARCPRPIGPAGRCGPAARRVPPS